MSDLNGVAQRLAALFLERFHIEVPSADTDLLATGMLDSMQLVELLLELEQRFGLRISIDSIDVDDLRTLSRIARVVAASAAPPATALSGV
jgi:D-alanine--poly(phosphoribitol) ligase subunit 2